MAADKKTQNTQNTRSAAQKPASREERKMSEKTSFNATVEALFRGMDDFITTKTVVGQPTEVGNVTIVPLADVSFGIGAGVFSGEGQTSKNNAGGGIGGKILPSAVLVIGKDGSTRLVRMNEKEDVATRILNEAPGVINRFLNRDTGETDADEAVNESEDEVKEAAEDAASETAKKILNP